MSQNQYIACNLKQLIILLTILNSHNSEYLSSYCLPYILYIQIMYLISSFTQFCSLCRLLEMYAHLKDIFLMEAKITFITILNIND